MTLSTDVYWIRHAPTNTTKIHGWGDIDCDLSNTDMLQRLERALPADALVVASDLKRASKTADMISGHRTRLPDTRELRELNFGRWDGKTADQIIESDGETARKFWSDPMSANPPGGESWASLTSRVSGCIYRLIHRFPERPIVAVAHYGVILSQLMHVTGAGRPESIFDSVANLSLSKFSYDGSNWHVREFNRVLGEVAK